jgi:hypothetical protein
MSIASLLLSVLALQPTCMSFSGETTVCFEHIIMDQDTFEIQPSKYVERVDLERVGSKCYKVEKSDSVIVYEVVINRAVVDTIVQPNLGLTCTLWTVREGSDSEYTEFEDRYFSTQNRYPYEDGTYRVVFVTTCYNVIGLMVWTHR